MRTSLKSSALALILFGGAAVLALPSYAVEPDTDSPAGPELPAPRYDRPDFQLDDQTGAPRERDIEGTDKLGAAPEIIIPEDDVPVVPPPAVPEP